MCRTYARQLYDITSGKDILMLVAKTKAINWDIDRDRSWYLMADGSEIEIDNLGGIKIDGKYL